MIKGSNATKLHKISKSFKEMRMLYSFLTSLVDTFTFLNVFNTFFQNRTFSNHLSDDNFFNWKSFN